MYLNIVNTVGGVANIDNGFFMSASEPILIPSPFPSPSETRTDIAVNAYSCSFLTLAQSYICHGNVLFEDTTTQTVSGRRTAVVVTETTAFSDVFTAAVNTLVLDVPNGLQGAELPSR